MKPASSDGLFNIFLTPSSSMTLIECGRSYGSIFGENTKLLYEKLTYF